MSRMSLSSSTPCPAPYQGSSLRRLSTNFSQLDIEAEDTANFDFTRALDHELIAAKPRRRTSLVRKVDRQASVTIFEDVPEEDEEVYIGPGGETERKSTLLSKPARRLPGKIVANNAQSLSKELMGPPVQQPNYSRRVSVAPRRTSILPLHPVKERSPNDRGDTEEARNARRRTIFIPNEDTTIMTIHPGAQDTRKLNDTFHMPADFASHAGQDDTVSQLTSIKPLKGRRRSLAVAPKRGPLMSRHDLDQNTEVWDLPGSNTGKENIPPHTLDQKSDPTKAFDDLFSPVHKLSLMTGRSATHSSVDLLRVPKQNDEVRRGPRLSMAPEVPKAHMRSSGPRRQSVFGQKSVALRNSPEFQLSRNQVSVEPAAHVAPLISTNKVSQADSSQLKAQTKPIHVTHPSRSSPKYTVARTSTTGPRSLERSQVHDFIALERRKQRLAEVSSYPVLSEDAPRTELYEDRWLEQQETGLTEMINQIFAQSEPQRDPHLADRSMRSQLLQSYHRSAVVQMHRILGAAIQHGALARPKDNTTAARLEGDIGLRKSLLKLWLNTYEETVLHAAVEVVIGRQIPSPVLDSVATDNTLDPRAQRRPLIKFLETFFISAADTEIIGTADVNSHLEDSCWNKVLLRSLMLIWLLDHAKSSKHIDGLLFKRKSPRKSSISVLQALFQLLLPSIGDPVRVLKHKTYEISHAQSPLEETIFQIDNIAVDLRDGTFLTRLVEVLMYSPKALQCRSISQNELRLQLSDNTSLEIQLDVTNTTVKSHPLTQHLKIPCLGHAQSIYNVQIALSALRESGTASSDMVQNITASDIVSGHREKTLTLLWSLVSTGLNKVINWQHLISDTQTISHSTSITSQQPLTTNEQNDLLQHWATTHATTQSTTILNLTTSFATGEAYLALLISYASQIPHLNLPTALPTPANRPSTLRQALRALNCSETFITTLITRLGLIPSREITIANLALLASRLLPLAAETRAATVLQRVWRARMRGREAVGRLRAIRCAYACREVVVEKQRLEEAARAVQKGWRGVIARRRERRDGEVRGFQALARGWIARGGGRERVLGGW